MAQHNSSQTLHQSQSQPQQQQPQQQQQQSPQQPQQQQSQQNGVTQLPQVVAASQQNNNLPANYPHHYPMPGSVFVPTQSPHGGAIFSVMPATLPGNVFVNNVTANVNLHGAWATHPAYIPAGQTFLPATGEIPQSIASMEPIMQPIVNQQNNSTMSRNGNRRNRNNSNPRNNSVNRRNDYNQRPHLNSPVPQDIANANNLEGNNPVISQGFHHPYAYPQFACQPAQFFNHVSPQQVSHSQAQQATGAPLYLASMYAPGPFFNYPVLISPATPAHMLSQAAPPAQEYQLGDERNTENVVDQHGQPIHINVPAGNMIQPQLWNPHEIPIEYQEEYHVIGNENNEDINHNSAVSITDSDTPSMLSPSGYSIHYDPNLQLIEAQQHMSSLQIYDQHGTTNDEEIHQQQIIQDQQPDQHYSQLHEQVVMISHEVNVYNPEPGCEQTEVLQEINPPLQQQIDPQINYQFPQQPHIVEQEEIYSQQFENNSPEKLEYKNLVETLDYNQNVPNIQQENGLSKDNLMRVQDLNQSTNSNESCVSIEPMCEQTALKIVNNNIMEEKSSLQFVSKNEYHSSPETANCEENLLKPSSTHIPIVQTQPQVHITNPAVLLPYQPLLPNQTLTQQPIEISNIQLSSAQVKTTVFNATQITKKTTASVAVTATPTQQHITTHVGISSNQIVPLVKTETSNIISLQPKTNVILQNQINNGSPNSIVLPQRERRIQSGVQVEQKSIASTAVPHQIQENNYHQPIINNVEIKKPEPTLIEQNPRKIEKKEDLTNSNFSLPGKENDTKATVNQPPPGPKSWASLFTPKPSNNTVPNSNNPSLINTTNHSMNINKKPVAKVLPFEGTVNVQNNINPGVLSYSAASAQGISPNNKQSSLIPQNVSSPSNVVIQTNGSLKSGKTSVNPQIASSSDNSDEWTIKYADFLKKYKTDFSPISLKPRGLKNPNNYCFINAVLQALIGCSPLYNLLKSAPKQSAALHLDKSKIPTINAMSQLIADFNSLPFGIRLMNRRDRTQKQNQKQLINNDELVGELQTDSAFEATPIYKLWNLSRPDVDEGRQGDAEEFLSYVLNKLNDEMLEVIKLMSKPVPPISVQQNGNTLGEGDEGGGDDWQMIYNNRNKGSVTRQTDFGKTPISDIFRGELRSRLQREGEHSTDVIQPFFTLQLNIEKAGSVREALEILVGRDQLEGVTCSKTNQEVVAWQQMNLEKLPLILIVHLKFFDYKSDGCTKIVKQFEFPLELKIDTKILASKKYSTKQKLYRLFAVVYHDGKEAVKGHYISDVYHSGYSNWLRYDDANVKPVSESSVLRPRGLRVPYLLFYRRCDTISTNSSSITSTPQQQQQQQQHQQHGSTHSK